MSDTFWTALSATATAAAFFAVTWRSILTRRALGTAQQALATADQALIASQAVALDAARTRLDGQAPTVSVRIHEVPWPPLAWTPHGMPVNPWPNGYEWHFPAMQEERIVLQACIEVQNHAQSHVTLDCQGDLYVAVEQRPTAAGSSLLFPEQRVRRLFLQKDFTIKELSENYEAQQAGRPLPHRVEGSITVHDGRDNGVTDAWDLELTGCPVRPVEERQGLWVVAASSLPGDSGADLLEYEVQPPRRRIYWVSRQRGEQLPEPTFTINVPGELPAIQS
ncbi:MULTISPECIES: hypothetical protein [unclassified Streptomyces]|uniref:hypothetical protein n=1 Tax=unclassified Streptomyces TaxID=2593676 RepID=UPI000DC768D0|nr:MULTISPECIES: hypothetical protein [unclassified Streptomyces]AWZ05126.1 hypothetical protein DRB89_11200 [Streptomyces sp. ICC4]AWZ12619.1 hypothetical protein DRB96_10125 [Streptomyces sp. ICC1]